MSDWFVGLRSRVQDRTSVVLGDARTQRVHKAPSKSKRVDRGSLRNIVTGLLLTRASNHGPIRFDHFSLPIAGSLRGGGRGLYKPTPASRPTQVRNRSPGAPLQWNVARPPAEREGASIFSESDDGLRSKATLHLGWLFSVQSGALPALTLRRPHDQRERRRPALASTQTCPNRP